MPPEQVTAFAPGRVNLIGEHTDYNLGLALPFAIAEGITVTAQRLDRGEAGDRIVADALDLDESDEFDLLAVAPSDGWRAFVRGAVAELRSAGVPVGATRLAIEGDLPRGAGLSSSAALEVALSLALLALSGCESSLRGVELARLCSRVESDWVGARTGLLDQIASLCAQPEAALQIDFLTLQIEPVPLLLGDWRLVVLDSEEPHANAESGYNSRREECERACALLGVSSLRDVSAHAAADLPEPLRRRASHVLTENERVSAGAAALRAGELRALGELLDASHASLRDDYEVSSPALETAVRRLRDAGAAGARLIGGGFGGSALGLLPPGAMPPADARDVAPCAGARLLA